MKNAIPLLLLSLWIIPACKKNALPSASGNTLNKTVQTISGTSPSQTVDSFIYNGQQRLSELVLSGSNPSFVDTVTFQYDASGRMLSWILTIDGLGRVGSYELSYDGNGRVVKATAVPLLAGYAFSDFSFAYNTQGQLVADSTYAQHLAGIPSSGIMSYENWTYDGNGNAIADQYFSSSNLDQIGAPFKAGVTVQYRYDNQVNPYYHAGVPLFTNGFGNVQLLSPNNLVGGTTSDPSSAPPYTYAYAYYSNGLPRVQTSAWSSQGATYTGTTVFSYQ